MNDRAQPMMARHWHREEDGAVRCTLCPHACRIRAGKAGRCQVRRNQDGALRATSFGKISALALDPIEKKPLHFYHPGSKVLSVGSWGCNFSCPYCQNASIAQGQPPLRTMLPRELCETSNQLAREGNIGVAFTYNEPLIQWEYLLECAQGLQAQKQKVILVTNGYINPQPLAELLPHVDALNIDLKAFNDPFYASLCGGKLSPVLQTIAAAVKVCHVEVTTLLIAGHNDDEQEMDAMAAHLSRLDPDLPLHLSRYFPAHQFRQSPTDVSRMRRLQSIAQKHLNRVVLGNV